MKPEDLQKLVIFVMPYGKYQGRLIAVKENNKQTDEIAKSGVALNL